jgi:hypothetical protein
MCKTSERLSNMPQVFSPIANLADFSRLSAGYVMELQMGFGWCANVKFWL